MTTSTSSRAGSARAAWLAAALAAVLGLPAASARAVAPATALALLNAERAVDGIPAGIVENPTLSAACAAHDAYERANGGVLTHEESSTSPGYTAAGAYAGQHSVLAAGPGWAAGNPWETAPIHLAQLLAPRLAAMGIDDGGGLSCATTFPGYTRADPAVDVVYTSPGNGRMRVPVSELAAEGPYTPGQRVGIPAGTRTGPYIYVLLDGPGIYHPGGASEPARLAAATLTGPDGPVALRIVDNTTAGLENYLPSGGQLIPLAPLRAHATYTASVIGALVAVPARTFARTWSFTTAGTITVHPQVSLARGRRAGKHVRIVLRADAGLAGRRATVRVRALARRCHGCALKATGPVKPRAVTLATQRTLSFALPKRGHGLLVTVSVAAFTVGEVRYTAARASTRYVRG